MLSERATLNNSTLQCGMSRTEAKNDKIGRKNKCSPRERLSITPHGSVGTERKEIKKRAGGTRSLLKMIYCSLGESDSVRNDIRSLRRSLCLLFCDGIWWHLICLHTFHIPILSVLPFLFRRGIANRYANSCCR